MEVELTAIVFNLGSRRPRASGSSRGRLGGAKKHTTFISSAGVVQHVDDALREQHGHARTHLLDFAAHEHAARSLDDVDHFLAVRMRVRRRDLVPGRDADHTGRTMCRRAPRRARSASAALGPKSLGLSVVFVGWLELASGTS